MGSGVVPARQGGELAGIATPTHCQAEHECAGKGAGGLYFGHKDVLNIKGRGEMSISVTVPLAAGNAALDLLWEYWGEDKEQKKDRWISLDVQVDGTDGLRQNGEVLLYKGLDGEIKEAKLKDIFSATGHVAIKDATIAETKNRWVRLSLKTKLTGDLCSILPTVDTLHMKAVPGEPVPIKEGFFNDVALDYTKTSFTATITDCGGPVITRVPRAFTAA